MSTETEIARRIALGCYGLEPQIEPLARLNHAVFRLRFPHGSKILKMARGNDTASLRKELMVIDLLHQKGIPAPTIEFADPLGTQLGRPFFVMRSAGERRVADSASELGERSRSLFFEMGVLQARIHAITLPGSGDLGPEGIVPRDAEALRAELDRHADWAVALGYLARDEAQQFQGSQMPGLEGVALCHGDFHPMQCVEDQGRIAAVLDWESAWAGNPEIDLAVTHAYLDFYCPFATDRMLLRRIRRRAAPPLTLRRPLGAGTDGPGTGDVARLGPVGAGGALDAHHRTVIGLTASAFGTIAEADDRTGVPELRTTRGCGFSYWPSEPGGIWSYS